MAIRQLLLALLFFLPLTVSAQPAWEKVGGCLVINLRTGSLPTPTNVREYCNRVQNIPYPNGRTFQDVYSWTPVVLAAAFDEAERTLSGRIFGVSDNLHVRLVLIPNQLPNAAVGYGIHQGKMASLDIMLTSSLVDFIEGSVSAYMIDMLRDSPDRQEGLGFYSWLDAMREAADEYEGDGVPQRTPWPGPREMPPLAWHIRYTRVPAQSVYQFIFGHELSHLVLGVRSGGDSPEEQLEREITCDRHAFLSMTDRGEYVDQTQIKGNVLPTFIVNFLVGMWYYESLTGEDWRNVFNKPGAPPTFRSIFPARDWRARADVVVEEWDRICKEGSSSVMCMKGWEDAVEDAIRLIESRPPNRRHKNIVADFAEFLRLKPGDTAAYVISLFGQPERRRETERLTRMQYFDGGLTIAVRKDNQKIRFVTVDGEAAVAALRAHGFDDAPMDIIGRHVDSVRRIYGDPQSSDAGRYDYLASFGNDRGARISFACYNRDDNRCSELRVQWFRK